MSLILTFPDDARRESFLALVRRQRPELVPRLEVSPVLPHLLARTDPQQDRWLAEKVDGYGLAFGDVKFSTFATT